MHKLTTEMHIKQFFRDRRCLRGFSGRMLSSSTPRVDCVVAGAGSIGLSCAKLLAESKLETIVLERAEILGSGISSRNSEVIHAGIYYKTGTLKSRLCVHGRDQLYKFLTERAIPHKKCGKLLVATSEAEVSALMKLMETASKNGVNDLKVLDAEDARKLEPHVRCVKALFSPSTGILDSHSYMQQLLADAENAGASCVYDCTVESGECVPEGINLQTSQGPLYTKFFINATGLHSIQLAHKLSGLPKSRIPRSYFAKGNYFKLDTSLTRVPFSHLVYPVPEVGGLGIHATIDLSGAVKFGPDVEWLSSQSQSAQSDNKSNSNSQAQLHSQLQAQSTESGSKDTTSLDLDVPNDFTVNPNRSKVFYAAIRKYWPDLPDDSLVPDYSGIRPKLALPGHLSATTTHRKETDSQKLDNENNNSSSSGSCVFQGSQLEDFIIDGPEDHGISGLVNLFGIESPGLTASLAIGEMVRDIVQNSHSKSQK